MFLTLWWRWPWLVSRGRFVLRLLRRRRARSRRRRRLVAWLLHRRLGLVLEMTCVSYPLSVMLFYEVCAKDFTLFAGKDEDKAGQ